MNKNKERVVNLSLDKLVEQCVNVLELDKSRYRDNLDYYHSQVANSDKSNEEKQRIGKRLHHEYWRNLIFDKLLNRIDTKAILPFLWGLGEAKEQMKLTGKSEFVLIYDSKTNKVNVN